MSPNIAFRGLTVSDVLVGRPYGMCAILWHSNLNARVTPLIVNSRRVRADLLSLDTDSVKIILVNVYICAV